MDIKISGITEEIMEVALEQALEARQYILGEMNKVISKLLVTELNSERTIHYVSED